MCHIVSVMVWLIWSSDTQKMYLQNMLLCYLPEGRNTESQVIHLQTNVTALLLLGCRFKMIGNLMQEHLEQRIHIYAHKKEM